MTFTRAEVADRAGIDPAFVDRLCDLGILTAGSDGFTEGDVRRIRLVNSLQAGGPPLEAMAEVASRIADYARQNEVLVSEEVVAASPDLPGVRFDPIGPVELKGLTEAVSLHVARRA